MVIRFQQFTNTEHRRSSFMKNFRRPKTEDIRSWKISEDRRPNIFVHEKFPNTEDRIVLFGPNYSRIPKNRSIRCNSDISTGCPISKFPLCFCHFLGFWSTYRGTSDLYSTALEICYMIATRILKIDLEIAEIFEVKVGTRHLEIDILLLQSQKK